MVPVPLLPSGDADADADAARAGPEGSLARRPASLRAQPAGQLTARPSALVAMEDGWEADALEADTDIMTEADDGTGHATALDIIATPASPAPYQHGVFSWCDPSAHAGIVRCLRLHAAV
jgi:hypothetical protein